MMARRRDEDDDDDRHKLIEEEDTDDVGDARSIMDSEDEDHLSLDEILHLYKQPINEEQAWAVCYQCCRSLLEDSAASGGEEHVRIYKDGSVRFHSAVRSGVCNPSRSFTQAIESLGIVIYKALDYGLKENEERELSPPLEQLIDLMTNVAEAESDSCADEGYDEDEPCRIRGYHDIIKLCALHLSTPADAADHYQAVCRALYAETKELRSFLEKIQSAKDNLWKMQGDAVDEPGRELNKLQNADWAWLWVQLMRDLRNGVKLKKVLEREYNLLPIEFQLTPYEMLMDDIRSKRYKLRKVMVNGDIPPRLKKSAHEVILEFIRSRPPLNPVAERKIKPQAERPPSLHERILKEIKSERKLRPVSPDMIRRSRFDVSSSDDARKASSTLALANSVSLQQNGSGGFRKKRLQAPTLAELDSSDSDDETLGQRSASCSSISTSVMDDTSPESVLSKKTPPMFLPISSTPQPERRQHAQRRHSIEKETPTSVRHFLPPSRHSSKSLEEFCFPVECLSLTVEEVMHIRQVLVKAELEKFQQFKDIYNAMKKGKLCFCCRTKRFSFFTWSYTCQFCKRPVCSQCCKKMRLPSKPYGSLPIYSLGPSTSTLKRDADGRKPENPSLQRTVSRLSKHTRQSSSSQEEMGLPKELMEDWSTMEVCVDCKKFISDIIASSKHSLSLANKRARLKRKTQSFIDTTSEKSAEYRPSERTINEV
ncbi:protein spire homolog 1-like [Carassius carassius]|uniref:protein spire homolog 1-like n=1 Tax=Carassius carassius TaxID=217509 RepID=UPI0028691FBF|nr:protein spire homolog 1-like [Carassius carassius]